MDWIQKLYYMPNVITHDSYLNKSKTDFTFFYINSEGYVSAESVKLMLTLAGKDLYELQNFRFDGLTFEQLIGTVFHEKLFIPEGFPAEKLGLFEGRIIETEYPSKATISDFIFKFISNRLPEHVQCVQLEFE